jgi:hypothetical protein
MTHNEKPRRRAEFAAEQKRAGTERSPIDRGDALDKCCNTLKSLVRDTRAAK